MKSVELVVALLVVTFNQCEVWLEIQDTYARYLNRARWRKWFSSRSSYPISTWYTHFLIVCLGLRVTGISQNPHKVMSWMGCFFGPFVIFPSSDLLRAGPSPKPNYIGEDFSHGPGCPGPSSAPPPMNISLTSRPSMHIHHTKRPHELASLIVNLVMQFRAN